MKEEWESGRVGEKIIRQKVICQDDGLESHLKKFESKFPNTFAFIIFFLTFDF